MPRSRREGELRLASSVAVLSGTHAVKKGTAMASPAHTERAHDKTLEDSFPASDPPANTGITGAEPTDTPAAEAIPTGLPTSDRYHAETAHHDEPETKPSAKP
jgi:hypothetical protein